MTFISPVFLTGTSGIAIVTAIETLVTADPKCQPYTVIGHFNTTNNTQATAYTSPSLTTGTWKVNIALVADANDNVNGGAWDISFVLKHTGALAASILGIAPGNVAPDNGSAGTSAWRATVDTLNDTFRLRITGDTSLATQFGFVVQIIPVIQ